MLSVIMLSVIMLSVIMLNVVAPDFELEGHDRIQNMSQGQKFLW
jgi:hypothetical protein